jgi:hypothetical protein
MPDTPIKDHAWFFFRGANTTLADVREKLVSTLRPDVFQVQEDAHAVLVKESHNAVKLRITTRDVTITVDWIARHLQYVQATKAGARRIERLRKQAFDRCLQLSFDDLDESMDALMLTVDALRNLTSNGWTYYRWNSKLMNEADRRV